jgi:hypothetical protein
MIHQRNDGVFKDYNNTIIAMFYSRKYDDYDFRQIGD